MRTIVLAALLLAAGCSLSPSGTCSTDAQCGAGRVCTSGLCVGCDRDADCRSWQSCDVGARACVSAPHRCVRPSECLGYEVCDADHWCVLAPGSCYGASDCTSLEDCTANRCRLQANRCHAADDCPGFFPGCTASNWCSNAPADGNDVLIWGTLIEGQCDYGAVAPVSAPARASPGFTCFSGINGDWPIVDPNGWVVFADAGRDPIRLVRFRPDSVYTDGDWIRESDYWLNDVLLPSSCGTGPVTHFVIQEDTGAYAYACQWDTTSCDYLDANGATVVSGAGYLRAWNSADALLGTPGGWGPTFNAYVWDAARTRRAVTGLPVTFSIVDARANGAGFRVAGYTGSAGSGAYSLYSVDDHGVATKIVDYGPMPSGTSAQWRAALDLNGALYLTATDGSVSDAVVMLPADGAAGVVVYTEKDKPANANKPGGPLWVLMHGSPVIRGP